ncbi:hypothetical protein MKA51_09020 [[Clostridium] innocuum]|nr:hypothetical protein [[Clostridium] innocuum]
MNALDAIALLAVSKAAVLENRIESALCNSSYHGNPYNIMEGFLYYFPSISNYKGRQTLAKKYVLFE